MVKRGVTTFSATKVAKAGLAASAALEKILGMEKKISRLRHHVSVLSKRNHGLQKELEGLRVREEEKEEDEEVASREEPEPSVAETVAEPSESDVVADKSMGSSVAPMSADEEEVRERVVFDDWMADLRDCMSDEDVVVGGKIVPLTGYTPKEEVEVLRTVVPTGPRGSAPLGPAVMVGGRRVPDSSGRYVGRGDRWVANRYRFVDRSLVGERNGMVGDTYHARGERGSAPVKRRVYGLGSGNYPYR